MFCRAKSYLSRVFPIPRRPGLRATFPLALLFLVGCGDGQVPSFWGDRENPRLCGVPPWHGREAVSAPDKVNRALSLCLWQRSRVLRNAPATNDELARAIVGGCWDRVSAWGRVVSPDSSIEDIDRVVGRLQLQTLYWVVEARAGNCRLPPRSPAGASPAPATTAAIH